MVGPHPAWVHGIAASPVQDLAVLFVELHEVSVSPFLQPVEVPLDGITPLCCISHSSQCCITSKLAEGALCSIIQIICQEVSSIGPSVEPWGTPLVTCLPLDFVPLFTTLWSQSFSQFSVHLPDHLYNPYFVSLSVMILWETVSKALLKPRQTTPVLSPHPLSQAPNYRRLSGCSSTISPSQINAGCSPSLLIVPHVWKCFPGGFCAPPFQGWR